MTMSSDGYAGVSGTPDFDQVMAAYPGSAPSAWAAVQAQLNAEGATTDMIDRAKQQFGTQMNALVAGFQSDIGQAAKGAAEYVKAGYTIGGAVMHVEGLIAGAKNEPPAQLVQTSVGVMLGVLVASGAMTAGVGAAVTGVVAVLTMVLDKAGLFGKPPAGTEICPGIYVNPKPDWVVGCVGFMSPTHDGRPVTAAQETTSGAIATNRLWLRFPRPDRDKDWYATGYLIFRTGIPQGGALEAPTYGRWTRKIDAAFPMFAWIEWDEQNPDPRLGDFQRAYATAWRINAERALNGQQSSSDAEVLYHTALAWNNAHASAGSGDIYLRQQDLPYWDRKFNPPAHGPYVASLIGSMQGAGLTDNFGPDGQSLRINMGARKVAVPEKVVALHLAHLNAQPRMVPLHLAHLAPGAVAPLPAPVRSMSQLFNAPPTLTQRVLPYVPAAVGVALLPMLGPVAPAVGVAASAFWKWKRGE